MTVLSDFSVLLASGLIGFVLALVLLAGRAIKAGPENPFPWKLLGIPSALLAIGLLVFVVDRRAVSEEQLGAEFPEPTMVLVHAGDFFISWSELLLFVFSFAIICYLTSKSVGEKGSSRFLLLLFLTSLGMGALGIASSILRASWPDSGIEGPVGAPTYSRQLVQTRGNFVSPDEVKRIVEKRIARERASGTPQPIDEDRLRVLIRQILEEELARVPASATEDARSSVPDGVPASVPSFLTEADVNALIPPSLTEDDIRAIVRETLPEDKWNEERIREIAAEIVAAVALDRSDVETIARRVAAAGQATPEVIRRVVGAMNLAGGGHDHAPKADPETLVRLGAIEASLKELSGGDLPIVSEVIVARLYAAAIRSKVGAPRDALTLRVDEIEGSGRRAHLTLSINGVEYKARNLGVDASFGPFEVGGREYVFEVTGIVGVPENRVTGVLRMN